MKKQRASLAPVPVRFRLRPGILLALTWISGLTVFAQSPPRLPAEGHLTTIFPAAAGAPAPAWVRPGTLLNYYGGAAIIPDDRMFYFRDEQGGWVDEEGNRYRGEEAEGHGAVGYTQVTVAALDGRSAVLDIRLFSINPSALVTAGCCVGPAGAPADYWINPQVLRQIPDQKTGRYRVIRHPFPLSGGRPAIRFHYQDRSTRYTQVFDLETGALLHSSTGSHPSFDQSGRGGQLIAHCTLTGIRQIQLPWLSDPVPGWVETLQSIQYHGRQTITVTAASTQQFNVEAQARVNRRGPGWLQYTMRFLLESLPGMPSTAPTEVERVGGPAMPGGLWIPPSAMPRLRTGQLLDRDPVTGTAFTVGQTGDPFIIEESTGSQQTLYGYDRITGMLVFYRRSDQTSPMVRSQVQFQLTRFQ